MHVLIIPSWFPRTSDDVSGVFFLDQAEALVNAGSVVGVIAQYPVSLLSFFSGQKKIQGESQRGNLRIYRESFLVTAPKIPYGVFWLWLFAAQRQFKKYIERHGLPDVIHAHSAVYAGAIAVRLGRRFNIPVVITEHSSAFALGLYSGWERRLAIAAFRTANARIAVSRSLADTLSAMTGSSILDFQIVPNVVSQRFYESKPKDCKSREIFRLVSVGSLDGNKNQASLIRAFASIAEKISNAELWIVGDGPERRSLEIMAGHLVKDGQVKLLGAVAPTRVPTLMATADVVVISSNYETFGLASAEALVLGKVVIATRCGGPEDIVTEKDGVLVPPNAPQSLAESILHVYANRGAFDAQEISRRARARYSGAAISAALLAIYGELINNAKH